MSRIGLFSTDVYSEVQDHCQMIAFGNEPTAHEPLRDRHVRHKCVRGVGEAQRNLGIDEVLVIKSAPPAQSLLVADRLTPHCCGEGRAWDLVVMR